MAVAMAALPLVGGADGSGTFSPASPKVARAHADVLQLFADRTPAHTTRIDSAVTTRSAQVRRVSYLHLPCQRDDGHIADGCQPPIGPMPVVVAAHGLFNSPRYFDEMAGWVALADLEGFAVVFPTGYAWSWNGGECCYQAVSRDVDDIGFLNTLVTDLLTDPRLDPQRVYYVGYSNGGMLGLRLNCTDQGPFAAFAVVHAAASFPVCAPASPRPLLAINGLQDQTVPHEGCTPQDAGTGCAWLNVTLRPTRQAVEALWLSAGCTGVLSGPYADGVTRYDATGCDSAHVAGMSSILTLEQAAHPWVTDESTYGINETDVAWVYLEQFRREQAS